MILVITKIWPWLRTHGFYITIVEHSCCVMSDCQHANILVVCWFGGSTDILAQGYVSKRCLLASWCAGVESGCGGSGRVKVKWGVPCWQTGCGEGRTWGLDWRTRRPGGQLRWLTLETSISASVHGGGRVRAKLLAAGFAGLGLKTRAEVPMRTNGTWRHRWDCFGARLPVRRRRGRRI